MGSSLLRTCLLLVCSALSLNAKYELSGFAAIDQDEGTIAFWIKNAYDAGEDPTGVVAKGNVMAIGVLSPPQQTNLSFLAFTWNGKPALRVGWNFDGEEYGGPYYITYNPEGWQHIAMTWERGHVVRFYVNGKLVQEDKLKDGFPLPISLDKNVLILGDAPVLLDDVFLSILRMSPEELGSIADGTSPPPQIGTFVHLTFEPGDTVGHRIFRAGQSFVWPEEATSEGRHGQGFKADAATAKTTPFEGTHPIVNGEFRFDAGPDPAGWNVSIRPPEAKDDVALVPISSTEGGGIEVDLKSSASVCLSQLCTKFSAGKAYCLRITLNITEFHGIGQVIFETQDRPGIGQLSFSEARRSKENWTTVEKKVIVPPNYDMKTVALQVRLEGIGACQIQRLEAEPLD